MSIQVATVEECVLNSHLGNCTSSLSWGKRVRQTYLNSQMVFFIPGVIPRRINQGSPIMPAIVLNIIATIRQAAYWPSWVWKKTDSWDWVADLIQKCRTASQLIRRATEIRATVESMANTFTAWVQAFSQGFQGDWRSGRVLTIAPPSWLGGNGKKSDSDMTGS